MAAHGREACRIDQKEGLAVIKDAHNIRVRFSLAAAGGYAVTGPEGAGIATAGEGFLHARSRTLECIELAKRVEDVANISISLDRPLLVIDVEATCDDGGRMPRASMETIEIGAVLLDGESLEPMGEFTTFVQPRKTGLLTPFCTKLTSIKQSDVDNAPRFAEAVDLLRKWIESHDTYWPIFASWGAYDREQLLHDAEHHRTTLPFSLRESEHINLKTAFTAALGKHVEGEQKKLGTQGALSRVGLTFEGTHHRGIDDARNIARLVPWCFGRRTDTVMPDPDFKRVSVRRSR